MSRGSNTEEGKKGFQIIPPKKPAIPKANPLATLDSKKTKKKEKDLAKLAEAKQEYALLSEEYRREAENFRLAFAKDKYARPSDTSENLSSKLRESRKALDKAMMATVQYEVEKLQVGDTATLVYVNYDSSRARNDLHDFNAFIDAPMLAELKTGMTPSLDEDFSKPWKLISVELISKGV